LKNLDLGCTWKNYFRKYAIRFGRCRDISTDKATVSTNVPSFQIDGEYCGSETNLNIEILPKQLKVYFKYKQWCYLNGLRSCHGVSGSR
jgi:hypothetical protein